jgi:hypothetical protein
MRSGSAQPSPTRHLSISLDDLKLMPKHHLCRVFGGTLYCCICTSLSSFEFLCFLSRAWRG